jgi:hypothetical protein
MTRTTERSRATAAGAAMRPLPNAGSAPGLGFAARVVLCGSGPDRAICTASGDGSTGEFAGRVGSSLWVFDGEELPRVGDALERMGATISEWDA